MQQSQKRTRGRWLRFIYNAAVILASGFLLAGNAMAATYYWDSDGDATGNNINGTNLGGSGTWNTASSLWWLSGGGSDTTWLNANHTAQFAGTAGTVSLGENISGGNTSVINFDAANYILDLNNFTLAVRNITGTGASTATINNSSANNKTFTLGGGQTVSATLDSKISGNIQVVWGPSNGQGNVLTLSNSANNYSGGTRINFGAVAVADNNALGSGAISVGTNARVATGIRSDSATARTIANSLSLGSADWMRMIFGSATTGDLTFNGASSIGGATVWEFQVDNANTSFANTLSGGSILRKTGTGNLNLSGTNSFSGGLYITAGTVAANSLANVGSNSAIGNAPNNTITATSFPLLTLANGGTLKYTAMNAVGGGAVNTDRLFAVGPGGGTINSSGSGAIRFTNTGMQTPERATANTSGLNTLANTLPLANATVQRLVVGMVVTGANVPADTTITSIDTQNSRIGVNTSIPANTVASGTTLSFGYGTRTLTLTGSNTGANTIAGILQNSATGGGTLGLTKSGAGVWLLSGANTYGGGTLITNGTLCINNTTGSGTGTGGVTVYTDGILGGSGFIDPSDTLTVAVNGRLAPGGLPTTVGTLTVGSTGSPNDVTFSSGSTFAVQIDGPTADRLVVHGTATLSGTLEVTEISTPAKYEFLLLSADNPLTTSFVTFTAPKGCQRELRNGNTELWLMVPPPPTVLTIR